MTTKLGA